MATSSAGLALRFDQRNSSDISLDLLASHESFWVLKCSDEQWVRMRAVHQAQSLRQHGAQSTQGSKFFQLMLGSLQVMGRVGEALPGSGTVLLVDGEGKVLFLKPQASSLKPQPSTPNPQPSALDGEGKVLLLFFFFTL